MNYSLVYGYYYCKEQDRGNGEGVGGMREIANFCSRGGWIGRTMGILLELELAYTAIYLRERCNMYII